MDQELFRQLNVGTKFDAAQCGDAWNLFRKGRRLQSNPAIDGQDETGKRTQVEIPDLDFFGTKSNTRSSSGDSLKPSVEASSTKKPVKRKRRRSKAKLKKSSKKDDDGPASSSLILLKNARKIHPASQQTTASEGDNDDVLADAKAQNQAVAALRSRMSINVRGDGIPAPVPSFDSMPLPDSIRSVVLRNIEKSDYKEPMPIQMQSIPVMLDGRDLLAAAPTGSGKTLAFLIPALAQICRESSKSTTLGAARVLVLAPTRELAAQIHREAKRISHGKKLRICLLSKATASSMAKAKVDMLVATPLRLVHLVRAGQLALNRVQLLIMDEADKLFELGFLEQIDEILEACNSKLQRALFSATLPEGVEEMARTVLQNPIRVVIGTRNACNTLIKQELVFVGREHGKLVALRQLVQKGLSPPVLIFVQSKERATELYKELVYDGLNIDTLHADRTPAQRDETMRGFRSGRIWVLIATDLLGRGVDFKGVKTVINYDFPQNAISYIHRIGRTGRAGRAGRAITFFTELDMPMLRSIANVMRLSGCDVPQWMLQMKKLERSKRKRIEKSALRRHPISTTSAYDKARASRRQNMIAQNKTKQKRRKENKGNASGNNTTKKWYA